MIAQPPTAYRPRRRNGVVSVWRDGPGPGGWMVDHVSTYGDSAAQLGGPFPIRSTATLLAMRIGREMNAEVSL